MVAASAVVGPNLPHSPASSNWNRVGSCLGPSMTQLRPPPGTSKGKGAWRSAALALAGIRSLFYAGIMSTSLVVFLIQTNVSLWHYRAVFLIQTNVSLLGGYDGKTNAACGALLVKFINQTLREVVGVVQRERGGGLRGGVDHFIEEGIRASLFRQPRHGAPWEWPVPFLRKLQRGR